MGLSARVLEALPDSLDAPQVDVALADDPRLDQRPKVRGSCVPGVFDYVVIVHCILLNGLSYVDCTVTLY